MFTPHVSESQSQTHNRIQLIGERGLVEMGLVGSVHTCRTWRRTGPGPKWHKFGRSVKYDIRDVEQFVASSRVA